MKKINYHKVSNMPMSLFSANSILKAKRVELPKSRQKKQTDRQADRQAVTQDTMLPILRAVGIKRIFRINE